MRGPSVSHQLNRKIHNFVTFLNTEYLCENEIISMKMK